MSGDDLRSRVVEEAALASPPSVPVPRCRWCDEGNSRVVSSIDPTGQQFVHHTDVGRVLCGIKGPVAAHANQPEQALRERIAEAIWNQEIAETLRKEKHHSYVNYAKWPADAAMQPYCQSTYRMADAVLKALAAPSTGASGEALDRCQTNSGK